MLQHELESVAARHVPGEGKVSIRQLSQGLVNETFRVLRDGRAYALRVAGADRISLGLDRAWEARVLERAVPAGLAPVLEYCDPQRGILISRWVEGRPWDPADAREPSNIARIGELVRRIQALPLPVPARLMSPLQWIDHYLGAAAQSGGTRVSGTAAARTAAAGEVAVDPAGAAILRSAASLRLTQLAELPAVDSVMCHSDLHTLNLIDGGHALVLLDWEYAHAADPLWDLAGWSANNDFDDGLRHRLLASYAGRPATPHEDRRLHLLAWLYDYVCLLWCDLYLNLHGGAVQDSVAARARKLAARLIADASSRAP